MHVISSQSCSAFTAAMDGEHQQSAGVQGNITEESGRNEDLHGPTQGTNTCNLNTLPMQRNN